MNEKDILILNMNKLHTTKMGVDRIRRNLNLGNLDVIKYCKEKIYDSNCNIYKKGKNFYCKIKNVIITVNSYSYTIITAHLIK